MWHEMCSYLLPHSMSLSMSRALPTEEEDSDADSAGTSGSGEPVAEYMLLVTDQYIRLYK